MFQATRRRLALWYTAVTAVLLLLFASGFYLYVRTTLVERVDDTLNHVVEIVEHSLVIEPLAATQGQINGQLGTALQVNVEASFRRNAQAVEDDHIDLEWFDPTGQLLWSTLSAPLSTPLHVNPAGETVGTDQGQVLRQITERVQVNQQVLGYLRVSHPWFEVTKPSRRLMQDLALGLVITVASVAAMGWLLSGLAMAPVRDSYQQLKQFTADASHELRNPIAVIQTNVQVALSDPDPDLGQQQQQLKVIERLTQRLGRLVDDLLFLARQEGGLIPLEASTVRVPLLLEELIEEQQVIATEGQISLVYQAPVAHLLPVMGDRDQLTRLFTNLIGNALQFTPAQGTITITPRLVKIQGQPWVQVQIADTGMGIEPAVLERVFDRFYRADAARHRRPNGGGTGLGLAIAKVIVDNHRGQIRLESQPHRGTTATVLLPAGDSPATAGASQP